MKEIPLPPEASQLLESLRSIGYSAEAAVADLIDNSITAESQVVEIRFPAGTPSHLAVIDDGRGMDADALIAAMRHGSRSPIDQRPANDLGRFGLGLKTASLSQCRCLTVVSKRDGQLTACRWDLDFVKKSNQWLLLQLDKTELESLPYVKELEAKKHGTMVLWTQLDRLAAGDKGDGAVVSARIDAVRRHLSLVFHRYLSGEVGSSSLRILINRAEVDSVDPFCLEEVEPEDASGELLHRGCAHSFDRFYPPAYQQVAPGRD